MRLTPASMAADKEAMDSSSEEPFHDQGPIPIPHVPTPISETDQPVRPNVLYRIICLQHFDNRMKRNEIGFLKVFGLQVYPECRFHGSDKPDQLHGRKPKIFPKPGIDLYGYGLIPHLLKHNSS